MAGETIPEDIRRFILTSIPSVPHIEAMLLLRRKPEERWDTRRVGQRLYVNDRTAATVLLDLCEIGVLEATCEDSPSYRYQPKSEELRLLIDRLADVYNRDLVEVSNLVHSGLNKKAQQFADAFIWRIKDG